RGGRGIQVGPAHTYVMVGFGATISQGNHFEVLFNESGLPPATNGSAVNWTVSMNGTIASSGPFQTLTSLGINEPNGTYTYRVAAPGYNATPSTGTVAVVGHPLYVSIAFTVNRSGSSGPCAANCSGTGGPPPLGSLPAPPASGTNPKSLSGLLTTVPVVGATTVLSGGALVSSVLYYRARGRSLGSPSDAYGKYRVFARPRPTRVAGTESSSERIQAIAPTDDRADFDPLAELLR
ncbi:MAG: hypothetical protein L3J97_06825, partial [Thermoplasmata archaeon]|nr:hypothetical protein [Thermoplasmata archaeon]